MAGARGALDRGVAAGFAEVGRLKAANNLGAAQQGDKIVRHAASVEEV